jgi:hypothetical protein
MTPQPPPAAPALSTRRRDHCPASSSIPSPTAIAARGDRTKTPGPSIGPPQGGRVCSRSARIPRSRRPTPRAPSSSGKRLLAAKREKGSWPRLCSKYMALRDVRRRAARSLAVKHWANRSLRFPPSLIGVASVLGWSPVSRSQDARSAARSEPQGLRPSTTMCRWGCGLRRAPISR